MDERLMFIYERRSIRNYIDKKIEPAILVELLKAGMAAPSACCSDPWRFLVYTEKEKLMMLANGLPYGKMLNSAAAGVVICGDIEVAHRKSESYLLQDCSAAVENLLLAAHAFGLGGVWLGVHPNRDRIEHIRKMEPEMPGNIIPVAVVSLGYPGKQPEARTRFKQDFVKWNRWDT